MCLLQILLRNDFFFIYLFKILRILCTNYYFIEYWNSEMLIINTKKKKRKQKSYVYLKTIMLQLNQLL